MIELNLPIATVSEANFEKHWRWRHRRAKAQRQAVAFATMAAMAKRGRMELPLRITFVRLSPRGLDTDNLQSAFKHVRDGVADAVGVDDRDARYTWVYDQEKSKAKGIRITIQTLESK